MSTDANSPQVGRAQLASDAQCRSKEIKRPNREYLHVGGAIVAAGLDRDGAFLGSRYRYATVAGSIAVTVASSLALWDPCSRAAMMACRSFGEIAS